MAAQEPGSPEAKPEPERASATVRVKRWLNGVDVDELLLVSSLLALCVLVKLLWLTHVDIYWDAGAKWHFVRQWSYPNDYGPHGWSHHMARFGVNVPAFLVQKVLGTAASVYHVVPIAMHALQLLFVYKLAKRLAGRSAGVLGALFMIFFTGMTRNASQLLPDGMVGTAAVLAGYTFLRFHEEASRARWRWLVATALGCIWAYAIKESSVLILPGFGLAVLLSKRSIKEAAVFSGIIGLYAAIETVCFRAFTGYAHRLAIVQEEHGFYPPITFWELFDRFGKLDPPWQMLFWLWVATVIYDLGSSERRRRLLLLLPAGYVFFLTFLVRGVDPIIQWMSFKPRYMSPAGGLFVAAVAVFTGESLRRAWSLSDSPRLARARSWLSPRLGQATFVFCALAGVTMYLRERPSFDRHPLTTLRRDAAILNDAFRRNLPIVEDSKTPRGLNTMFQVYLQPKYLTQMDLAKGGSLPHVEDAVRRSKHGKKYAYVLRDASAYGRGEMEELVEAGCGVVITTKARVILNVKEKLPESCKAPKGKPLPK